MSLKSRLRAHADRSLDKTEKWNAENPRRAPRHNYCTKHLVNGSGQLIRVYGAGGGACDGTEHHPHTWWW
jgi:hypothetical protein